MGRVIGGKREALIQRKVVSYARDHGAIAIKLTTLGVRGVAGWPDYLFVYNKRVVFMEFKRPGGKLTDLQKYRQSQLADQGFFVTTVDSADSGCEILADEFGWRP